MVRDEGILVGMACQILDLCEYQWIFSKIKCCKPRKQKSGNPFEITGHLV